MTAPLVIHHAGCADGFGAAWCFHHAYGGHVNFVAARHGDLPPAVAGREVFLVDFAYRRGVVVAMLEQAQSVTLIDHHVDAIADLAGVAGLHRVVDVEHSGAVLAWRHLFGARPPPGLLLHIEDRDLWRFQLPSTREIVASLGCHPFEFQRWDDLVAGGDARLVAMAAEGSAIERRRQVDLERLIAAARRPMCIGGVVVPVVNAPPAWTSEAAQLLAAGEPFAAAYWDAADGRCFGLRSAPHGVDVSQVAHAYGGGGHPHAAGFKVSRDHPLARD